MTTPGQILVWFAVYAYVWRFATSLHTTVCDKPKIFFITLERMSSHISCFWVTSPPLLAEIMDLSPFLAEVIWAIHFPADSPRGVTSWGKEKSITMLIQVFGSSSEKAAKPENFANYKVT